MRLILTISLLILGDFLLAQAFDWEQIEEIGLITAVDAPMLLEDRGEGFVRIAGRQDDWDQTSASWVVEDSIIYTNNADVLLVEELTLFFDGTIWGNDLRRTYEYEGGELSRILTEDWAVVEWVPLTQTVYEYDSELLLTFYIQDWINDAWQNELKWLYQYNANDHLEFYEVQMGEGQTWNDWLRTFVNVLNADGNPLAITSEFFEMYLQEWQVNSRAFYEYDTNGNRLTREREQWVNGQWDPSTFDNYDYTSFNERTLWQRSRWEDLTQSYNPDYRYIYEYDDDENLVRELRQDFADDLWINDFQRVYYYEGVSSTEAISSKVNHLTITPNPIQTDGLFQFLSPDSGVFKAQVVNLQGQSIWSAERMILAGELYRISIPNELPNGTYWLQVQWPNQQIETQSFVIIR